MDYQHFAEQHNAAYAAFTAIYQQKNPPPLKVDTKKENWVEVIILGVLVAASVIVSGSRTIAEFGGDFVGIAGFVMLELGVVAYAYIRTSKYYDKARHSSVKDLLTRGMWLAFTVAIVANVHATFKANGIEFAPVNIVIFLFLAIGAPTLALIAGDTLAMLVVTDKFRQRDSDKAYDEAVKIYLEEMNALWKREQAKWGVKITVEHSNVPMISVPTASNGIPLEIRALPAASSIGHTKAPDAAARVREYYTENPDALEISPLEISKLLGIGKSTVYNVRNDMRSGKEIE